MVTRPQEENQEGKGYRLSTVAREDVRIHSRKDFKEAVETFRWNESILQGKPSQVQRLRVYSILACLRKVKEARVMRTECWISVREKKSHLKMVAL